MTVKTTFKLSSNMKLIYVSENSDCLMFLAQEEKPFLGATFRTAPYLPYLTISIGRPTVIKRLYQRDSITINNVTIIHNDHEYILPKGEVFSVRHAESNIKNEIKEQLELCK